MRARLAVCIIATVVSAACGDDTTGLATALSLQKSPTASGDGQTDTVLAKLAPFRVLVLRGGAPAKGTTVLWLVRADTSVFLFTSTPADDDGIASLTLTFGQTARRYTAEATLSGSRTSVRFTATATAGSPTMLFIVSGNNQVDSTKARLASDYTVRLTDSHANVVIGAGIDWAVTAGGGAVTPTHGTTDSGGNATARHTLGPDEGAQTVTATPSGLPAVPRVTFAATAFGLGNLQLTATTTGVDLDPNGYSVSLDGSTLQIHTAAALAANGTVTIRLRAADYRVALSGVAVNCDTTGPKSRTVTVPSGGSAAATFDVACATATLLAFVSTADGNGEIYTIKSNGTALTRLTTNAAWDGSPAWSRDGTKIAFESDRDGSYEGNYEIYMMAADDPAHPVRLTTAPGADRYPSWSPDGTKIAFTSERDGNAEIYVLTVADPANLARLTNNPAPDIDPVWSPDGTKLAFWSTRDGGDAEVYVLTVANPTQVARLTNHAGLDADPAWSPDGSKLVFMRDYGVIMVMSANDGSGVTQVAGGSGNVSDPVWSPDGTRIAFANEYCDYYSYYYCSYSIMVVRANGTDLVELTDGSPSDPDWRH